MTDLNTAKINSLTQNVQQLRVRLDGIRSEMDAFGSLICKIEERLAALEDAENYRQQDEDVERACESGMLETLTERVAGSIRDVNIHGGTWEEQARAAILVVAGDLREECAPEAAEWLEYLVKHD